MLAMANTNPCRAPDKARCPATRPTHPRRPTRSPLASKALVTEPLGRTRPALRSRGRVLGIERPIDLQAECRNLPLALPIIAGSGLPSSEYRSAPAPGGSAVRLPDLPPRSARGDLRQPRCPLNATPRSREASGGYNASRGASRGRPVSAQEKRCPRTPQQPSPRRPGRRRRPSTRPNGRRAPRAPCSAELKSMFPPRRPAGGNVVVCGDDVDANRRLARAIESAVGPCLRSDPHAKAGPFALPHCHRIRRRSLPAKRPARQGRAVRSAPLPAQPPAAGRPHLL
jgi:hypothetical protein